MTQPVPMTELWRGPLLESLHLGHAVICDDTGQIVRSWGDPQSVIYPRSSAKMIQALPLVTSGAAAKYGLTSEHLALACASHNGAAIHTDRVTAWLDHLGLNEHDLRCGPQEPADTAARDRLILADDTPCQIHNNCSGKHCGFLTLAQHMGAGPEYLEIDHPVQQACLSAVEETTGETSPAYGIDGCSAPNFAHLFRFGTFDGLVCFSRRPVRPFQRCSDAAGGRDGETPGTCAGETRACTD